MGALSIIAIEAQRNAGPKQPLGIDFGGGVSTVGFYGIQMDRADNVLKASVNGGAWLPIVLGAGATLQTAYDAGHAIVTDANGAVSITRGAALATNALTVDDASAAAGTIVSITNASMPAGLAGQLIGLSIDLSSANHGNQTVMGLQITGPATTVPSATQKGLFNVLARHTKMRVTSFTTRNLIAAAGGLHYTEWDSVGAPYVWAGDVYGYVVDGQTNVTQGANYFSGLQVRLPGGAGGASTISGWDVGGANVAGENCVVAGGRGTGTAAGGSILFQTSFVGGAGATFNAVATRVTIDGAAGWISCPDAGANSERFGAGSSCGSGAGNTVIGAQSTISLGGTNNVIVGRQITLSSGGGTNVIVGHQAYTGGASFSVCVGANSGTLGSQAVVIGSGASDGSANNYVVVMGVNATVSSLCDYSVLIGGGSGGTKSSITSSASSVGVGGNVQISGGDNVVAMGVGARVTAGSVIALGQGVVAAVANTFVAGSNGAPMTNVYFGKGASSATPTDYTINGTKSSDNAVSGGAIIIAGGLSNVATKEGGEIVFKMAVGGIGTTLSTVAYFDPAIGGSFNLTPPNTSNALGLTVSMPVLSQAGAAGVTLYNSGPAIGVFVQNPAASTSPCFYAQHFGSAASSVLATGVAITISGGDNHSQGLEMADGRNVGVSAANSGRLIYNSSTQTFQVSQNGGAFASLPVSGAAITFSTGLGAIAQITGPSDQTLKIQPGAARDLVLADTGGTARLTVNNADGSITTSTADFNLGSKLKKYNNVSTAGWGVPAIYASGRVTAVSNAGSASIATYTPAADGSFIVSGNVLVTSDTATTMQLQVTYTDEGNNARTLVLNTSNITGTFSPNMAAAGAYEGVPLQIRAKAGNAITVLTTLTVGATIGYNAEGMIQQVS